MMNMQFTAKRIIVALTLIGLCAFTVAASAMNIDATNKYAWGENIGWINFGSTEGDVDVTATDMDGYAWGENVGWISLTCSNPPDSCGTVNYGVTISGSTVSGYAWGENTGWISFNCSNTDSCTGGATLPNVDYGVTVDTATGIFSGYAWGENVGWIVFNCATTSSCVDSDYKLQTAFVATPTPTPAGGGPSGGYLPPPFSTPTPSVTPTTSASPQPTTSPGVPPPSAPPPGSVPSSPPAAGIPPIVQFINSISSFFDSVFGSPGLGAQTVCVGPLGVAACGTTAMTGGVVLLSLLAAVAQSEWAATGYSLLQVMGVRRRAKVWGVVYDSRTKRTIPLAKLELLDASNRVLETRYADRDGRYGFLMSPASLHEEEVRVQVRVTKPGFTFPSRLSTMGTDYIVYDNLYRGGMIVMRANTLLSYNIPMDATAHARLSWSGFGQGLVGTLGDKLLSLGFYVGLVTVPLNWWLMPTTKNLVIGIVFFSVNAIRMFIIHRPYGVTRNALTGKPMPYALVILNDLQGNRQGFAVSDEYGRFILSGEQNKDYEIIAYTPSEIVPQRSIRLRVRGVRRISTRAWITNKLRI